MPLPEDISPRFVVHVLALLSAGKTENAISACRAGIARYPWYGTGYWLLGRCFEAYGDIAGANEQYRQTSARLPGVAAVQAAVERTLVQAVAGENVDVDAMLRSLQEARRSRVPQPGEDVPLVDISTPSGEHAIVTVTLAEIYAKQGKYREALDAYQRLIPQRPEDAGRHAVRIAELEELLQRADKLREL
jgi:tetratricopeptide (TPR) repeat protein